MNDVFLDPYIFFTEEAGLRMADSSTCIELDIDEVYAEYVSYCEKIGKRSFNTSYFRYIAVGLYLIDRDSSLPFMYVDTSCEHWIEKLNKKQHESICD